MGLVLLEPYLPFVNSLGIAGDMFHLVGHSLGAHAAVSWHLCNIFGWSDNKVVCHREKLGEASSQLNMVKN